MQKQNVKDLVSPFVFATIQEMILPNNVDEIYVGLQTIIFKKKDDKNIIIIRTEKKDDKDVE